jgi:hypothetical protein
LGGPTTQVLPRWTTARDTPITSAPADTFLRRSSLTSPQRIPHQHDISIRARNRSGRIASASAATSPTSRMTGSRFRVAFMARGMLQGLAGIRPSVTAVASTACSD